MNREKADTPEQGWIENALETFERPLVRYTYRFTHDLDEAREIVQDAFLKLCRSDKASVEGHVREWLYTVCRNGALDQLKKNRPMVPLDDEAQDSLRANAPSIATETPSKVVERHLQAFIRLRFYPKKPLPAWAFLAVAIVYLACLAGGLAYRA